MSDATGGATFKFTVEDREFLEALNRASNKLDDIPRSAALWSAGFGIARSAVSGFVETLNEWVTMAGEAELSMSRMDAVLSATGFAAGKTASEMSELASAIQRTTRFDDDAMMGAMAKLATFASVSGDTFERATKLAADLAETGFGSVESAATMLGKALEDPKNGITALTRAGVTLTATQKGMIAHFAELNEKGRAQEVILNAVAKQVGGVAEALGDTTAGKMARITNALGDMKEALGAVVAEGITPFMESIQGGLDDSSGGFIARLNDIASAVERISTGWVNAIEKMRNKPLIGSLFGSGVDAATTSHLGRLLAFIDKYGVSGKPGESVMDADSTSHFRKLSEDNRKYFADIERARQAEYDTASEESHKIIDAEKKRMEGVKKYRDEMTKAADKIRESLATPWDKALDKLAEINKLAKGGFLDSATRLGAVDALRSDLMKPSEDKFRDVMARELSAREDVSSLDKRIREAREGSGFTSSIESLAGMWSKIQTGAMSTSDDVAEKRAAEGVAELVKAREEAAKRWSDEKRILEETRDILRATSFGASATFR